MCSPSSDGDRYHFTVKIGTPPPEAEDGTKAIGEGANFRCIVSDTPISGDYIKAEGTSRTNGSNGSWLSLQKVHRSVFILRQRKSMEAVGRNAEPTWKPDVEFLQRALGFSRRNYVLWTQRWGDLFTPRQLVALTTFSDLGGRSTRNASRRDALAAGMPDDGKGLDAGGTGATAYAEAVSVYLAFALDRLS